MTHPTQEDDVKRNDIACLRINYDVEGWRKLTKGFTLPTVLPGAILAIDSLCDEVEQLRARLEQAERQKTPFRVLLAVTAEKNRMGKALELACSYLTDEQVELIKAAMPDDAHIAAMASEAKP